MQQLASGNLAPNPSFERKNLPTGGKDTEGWEKIGDRVEWMDRESGAAEDDVRHGSRAVRIHRKTAGELDEAEGVMSDFIPVIPGNYDLTYDVRLKNVDGNRRRLGGRLGDAVTVRVSFFDAEKKLLDPAVMNPVGGTLIDTSDKSYSFANYWSIDGFPWATVRARTYNYPFSEGDLPDRTRYVRLFFGLKGTGTLWLDNVVFRYSKWNFSALERLKPYIDRDLSPVERLNPTPKEIHLSREVVYLEPGAPDAMPPLIVLPDDPAPAERAAARLLEKKLNTALARIRPAGNAPELRAQIVERDFNANDPQSARLIFSIGKNRLMRRLSPDLPLASISGRDQGYIITPVETGLCHVVFLVGETAVSNFYAAATAAQLLEEDRCVYHSAAVIDYPDFLGRSYLLKRWGTLADLDRDLEGLELMSRHKLNKAYAGDESRTKVWHQPDALFKAGIDETGRWCRENGVISLGIMVNPYSHFKIWQAEDALSQESRYTWTHAGAESQATLQQVFKLGLEAGAGTIMLLADDFVPHEGRNPMNFFLYTLEDRERFVNLQNAQAYVINRLKAWIDRDYPGTRFEFCPPWYLNEFIDRSAGKAEVYLKELAALIPQEIAIIWTGPTVRSLSVDMADLRRYRDLIGRWPMFWDNTLYARNLETDVYGGYTTYYPGKVRMCNLFEPLDTDRPAGFHELNDGRHMYMNATAENEVYRIKFATVADFEWNTSAYIPELSLWKALVKAYGPACAREVLFFNEAYYGLYEVCMRMEREKGLSAEYGRRGGAWLARMDQSLSSLQRQLPPGHALVPELERYRDRQKQRLEGLVRESSSPN
ncbi:MAG: beta-N-acetylglucosaminidase domain-containing protein [Deltaproteobacteria bacterium]|nr:beta-N-acetylglucosaminidase domain-containing protein [Deltaproteobacteria bacterium]